MKYGLVLPNWEAGADVQRLVDAGVLAEKSGWDGVFLADHLIFPPPRKIGDAHVGRSQDMPDPWIVLSAIAVLTKTIRLGTWVTPVARRQPWQMARDIATLDRLSGGRVILGIGLGRRPDYELFGYPWSLKWTAQRTDEALDIIEQLWTGEPVTAHGENFDIDGVVMLPTPVQQPRVPILVGGLWPKKPAVRRGARWDGIMTHFPGDGVLPADGTPPEEHARDMVGFYRELAGDKGDVFLPMTPTEIADDWLPTCEELGATWLYAGPMRGRWQLDEELIAAGPQAQIDWRP